MCFCWQVSAEPVSLSQIASLCLKHNPQIRLAKINLAIAQREYEASEFDFDWNLTASYAQKNEHIPSSSIYEFTSYRMQTMGPSIGATHKFLPGTTFDASFQALEINTTSNTTLFKKRKQMGGQVTLEQPLLKGFGKSANTDKMQKAQLKIRRYQALLDDTIETELFETAKIFLDLYQALENLKMKESDLEYSQEILNLDEKRYSLGKKGKIDYLTSLAEFKKKQALIEDAKFEVYDQRLRLAQKTTSPDEDIHPQEGEPILQDILDQAWPGKKVKNMMDENLPALLALRIEAEESQVDVAKARNDRLPDISLKLGYTSSGLATHFDQAFNHVTNATFPGFEVSINFSYPLGNSKGNGGFNAASQQFHQANMSYQKKKKEIEDEAITIFNNYKQAKVSIKSLELQLASLKTVREYKTKLYHLDKISGLELHKAQNEYLELALQKNIAQMRLLESYFKELKLQGESLRSNFM